MTADDILTLYANARFVRPGLMALVASDLAATPTGELRSAWVRAGFSPRTFTRGSWIEKIRERHSVAERVAMGANG